LGDVLKGDLKEGTTNRAFYEDMTFIIFLAHKIKKEDEKYKFSLGYAL